MIQTLIFDFGGVLMRTVTQTPRCELGQRLGLSLEEVEAAVFGSPRWDEVQLGRITYEEFWEDVARRLGWDTGDAKGFGDAFWSGDRLDEEFMALIRRLRDEGYLTALLSNAPSHLRQLMEELSIADAFDEIVISGCEGVMKPDPAIFELTLARLGARAEEAVFVDDFRVNVVAARQVGLHAVRFRGLSPLRKQLRELGIPVPDPVLSPLPDVCAVIFDWGGVMEASPDETYVAGWERRLALEPNTLPEVLWGEVWRQLEIGAITNDDFMRHIADRLSLPDAEAAARFIEKFYTGDRFSLQVAAAVRALRGHYKVGLLTNAFPGQDGLIREQFGLDVHTEFDIYVNSAEVGLRKPDPAIFYLTLEQLGVAPQQAVFLDDNLRNVDSARELGIHTVQFVDPERSLAELETLLDLRLADLRFGDLRHIRKS